MSQTTATPTAKVTYSLPVPGRVYWAVIATCSAVPLIPGERYGVDVADQPTNSGRARVYTCHDHAETEYARVGLPDQYAVRAVRMTTAYQWVWADEA